MQRHNRKVQARVRQLVGSAFGPLNRLINSKFMALMSAKVGIFGITAVSRRFPYVSTVLGYGPDAEFAWQNLHHPFLFRNALAAKGINIKILCEFSRERHRVNSIIECHL